MTHILLIHAGPTPWDVEDRLVGNHPLPLTDLARATIEGIVKNLAYPISVIYRFRKNEAVEQAAKIVAERFQLRPHESTALDEVNLGLWQGLTRADLKFRFPSVFPQWEENPLAVNPPDGESLPDAIVRLQTGIKRILRRNRGVAIALPLRPMAMQITLGLLRGETPEQIAGHLHNTSAVETITLSNDLHPLA
jgi:broad specificity phosphatase PhoE